MDADFAQIPINIHFSCTTELNAVAFESDNPDFVVMASLKAPYFDDTKRAPVDIVASIDRSGSMSGDKLQLAKETLSFTVKQLQSKDRFGLVVYDDNVSTVLDPVIMDSMGKERAKIAIGAVEAGGSTDLCGGLVRGIDTLKNRSGVKNDVSSVLFLTDGLANAGITSTEGILQEMDKRVNEEKQLPCSVHTFGFGSDHDANMLKTISDKANGIYFFVENKDQIADAFADCLGGLLSVVAQNITLELKAMPGVSINTVNTSYKVVVTTDNSGNSIHTVQIGDIQSEEERDILLSVSIKASDTPILQDSTLPPQPLVVANLTYFNVLASKQEEVSGSATIWRPVSTENVQPNPLVDRQKNRIITAEALVKAKAFGDQNNYSQGRQVLQEAITKLEASISKDDDFVKSLIVDLKKSMEGLQDRDTYTSYGGYTMSTYSCAHHQQRSVSSTTSYSTQSRTMMKAQYHQQ